MLYREIPFARLTLPLMAGILLAPTGAGGVRLLPLLVSFLLLVSAFFLSSDRRGNTLYGLLLLLMLVSLGYMLAITRYRQVMAPPPQAGVYRARIDSYPRQAGSVMRVQATLNPRHNEEVESRMKMVIYLGGKSGIGSYGPGDLADIRLRFDTISDFNPDDDFDYARYMLLDGFRYYSFASLADTLVKGVSHSPATMGRVIQERLMRRYGRVIENSVSLSLVSALTLGYRSLVEEEITGIFRRAGISHVMAVSGLHVGIISMVILWIAGLLIPARARRWRVVPVIIGVWLFALVSGMTPSVTRASLMFSFLHAGRVAGRHVHPINSLLASAFVLLVASPPVIYAPGFQLSYAAVFSILLLYRRLHRLVELSGSILGWAWSLTVVTLLAQIGTLPFVLYHFGTVSPYSLVTNLFAIPLVTAIIITGFILLFLPQSILLADAFAWLVTLETTLLLSISEWIAG